MNRPPDLLLFQDFGGDWSRYEKELNRIFTEKIAWGSLRFRNLPINCRRIPETGGRWASFWHLIQEGEEEDERTPDLRRCERLPWIPWVINNATTHPKIDEWQNKRGSETNSLLWYREEYLVVLSQRRGYWLLKTAYLTDKKRRIEQLRKERNAYLCASGQSSRKS